MNNTPKKEKKKERANDEERDELKKTNSAGSTEAHDNRDTEFGSIFLRRSPKKKRKNNSKAAHPKKSNLFTRKTEPLAQLLSGHDLAPHRMLGAPIPVP